MDPSAGYRAALEEHPQATWSSITFNGIRLASRAIDECHRRVQNQTLGHRGHKADPLYRARRVLLTGYERLSSDRSAWMQSQLAAGDPDGEVSACFIAKELLRDLFAATGEAHARRRMITFHLWCADADISELTRLAGTISRWAEQIFAYHRHRGCFQPASRDDLDPVSWTHRYGERPIHSPSATEVSSCWAGLVPAEGTSAMGTAHRAFA